MSRLPVDKTLARLSLKTSPGRVGDLEATYEQELAPLLLAHGLQALALEAASRMDC